MNTYNNLPATVKCAFTEACAKYCSYDLHPFETVNDKEKTTIRMSCFPLHFSVYRNSINVINILRLLFM